MSGLNILVTGGAGFIRSSLCERLVAEGHNVLAYDSLFRGRESNLTSLQDLAAFQFMQGDVRDVERLDEAVERFLILGLKLALKPELYPVEGFLQDTQYLEGAPPRPLPKLHAQSLVKSSTV